MDEINRRLYWRVYRAMHPLYRYRKQCPEMWKFVHGNITGTVLAVDSFPVQLQVDHAVELDRFKHIWNRLSQHPVELVASYQHIPTHTQYNTVLALGLTPFRYQTPESCAQVIANLKPLLLPRGNMLVALPITTLIFHRLKFSYKDVIIKLNSMLHKHKLDITEQMLDIDIFYLKVALS